MAPKTEARKKRSKPAPTGNLRLRSEARRERRFEPKTSIGVVLAMLGMSIGAVLVGAGTYGQWLRADDLGPHKLAPYLLGAGAVLFLAVALLGNRVAKPVRVGDAGVAQENDAADLERIAWCDVAQILLTADMITVQANGRSISVPTGVHAAAAARLLAEARARIPDRIEGNLDLPEPAEDDAEPIKLEAAQVAGRRCRESDRLITFEDDARLCGRCGEVYHKDSVPKSCATCGAALAT